MKKTLITSAIMVAIVGAVGAASIGPVMAHKGKFGGPRFEQRFNFEEIDANGDGAITLDEIEAHRAQEFTAKDTDSDGFLSPEELSAAALARMNENMQDRIGNMIDRHDSDGDGKLSMEEMSDGSGRMGNFFERVDADGDGAITTEETDAMKARFADRKGWGHKKRHGQDDNQ